jgi:hypothetical protein
MKYLIINVYLNFYVYIFILQLFLFNNFDLIFITYYISNINLHFMYYNECVVKFNFDAHLILIIRTFKVILYSSIKKSN